jgi:glucosamine--fructose-6-phosphate aminotransferase (isomerizing)
MLELPKKITEVLESRKTVERIAKEVHKKEDMYFIGRLSDYATALEGALKLKEVSYIHADAYPAGELKHGPIALIEKNVDVVGVATNKEIVAKTISNLEEVATRGANIILVTNVEESSEFSKIKDLIKIPKCDELISSILAVIPLQLLAYFVAKEKKLDVDKPRNLAKSVTVE